MSGPARKLRAGSILAAIGAASVIAAGCFQPSVRPENLVPQTAAGTGTAIAAAQGVALAAGDPTHGKYQHPHQLGERAFDGS